MKKLLYIALLSLFVISCDKDDENLPAPSNVMNVSAEPRIGGALVKWEIPSDSAFTYLEVRYLKNGKEVLERVSKYTDTLLVEGLINAEEFSFEVQAVNETPNAKTEGEVLTTGKVRPIRRSAEITFFPNQLNSVDVEASMLDTFTQEQSEGPKENLVDGDPSTYWHSAWSSGVAPLPHWIQINFDEPKNLGAIKYWFRQSANTSGRPQQWGLEVSEDAETWERVWESRDNLPISDNSSEHELTFDKNYESQYFRVMILKNGSGTFAHLGEISFYNMDSNIVDKEEEAEEEYYNF
ncbi:Anaphase-promoting complex (APC), subunit 10 [Salegentibacter holothuriorum]|uniref:Anaphase-promoting complex (APC), subunit 10 n=1 Tax=Salegentibacter holothuriorum TaxID=241145 RepID=A0A1T5DG88_9FLAO|nr:discoidin domain-containing protein [Salegentibacter holothuriorum]SKB70709.1 Anaphase-promoting complex (APC), subunit 10 [Salegentibacter holothuriorum]